MAIIRKDGLEAEVTLDELRALFGVAGTDAPKVPARATAGLRAKPGRASENGASAKPQAAMDAFTKQSVKGQRLAALLIERGEAGVLQQDLMELLVVTPPQVSRLIGSWREAAVSAGLKESAFVRFTKEGRGKRWFATNALTSALTISPQKVIPEPPEERA